MSSGLGQVAHLTAPVMLAQISMPVSTPAVVQIFFWIALAVLVSAALINQVGPAWDRITSGFQRRQTPPASIPRALGSEDERTFGARMRQDCIAIHKALGEDRERTLEALRTADEGVRKEIKDDIVGIHRRIDNVQAQMQAVGERMVSSVAELAGQIKQMNLQRHGHGSTPE
jgi:hypothetical protein